MLTMVLLAVLMFIVIPTVVAAFTIEADTDPFGTEAAACRDRHPANG
jgi:hypothetical protein